MLALQPQLSAAVRWLSDQEVAFVAGRLPDFPIFEFLIETGIELAWNSFCRPLGKSTEATCTHHNDHSGNDPKGAEGALGSHQEESRLVPEMRAIDSVTWLTKHRGAQNAYDNRTNQPTKSTK
jgi:hypothetical protein